MTRQQAARPEITWDGKTWSVTLPFEDGRAVEAKWSPGVTYVVRIREAGTEAWSIGFETPVTNFTFSDFKPDTEYEVQVRSKTAAGEGAPTFVRLRTGATGDGGNVVPFPARRPPEPP